MLSYRLARLSLQMPSMKVPPKRKGNAGFFHVAELAYGPSMKVPPKRKGNRLFQA